MSETTNLRLVAPWYRWQRQADNDGVLPRRSRPVFQKYTDPGLVNRFMEDPQASYRFMDDRIEAGEDFVEATERSAYGGVPGGAVKKLFRPTHKRHYLVVCELHCDEPGLPDARLDHACEMGFVVRRWSPEAWEDAPWIGPPTWDEIDIHGERLAGKSPDGFNHVLDGDFPEGSGAAGGEPVREGGLLGVDPGGAEPGVGAEVAERASELQERARIAAPRPMEEWLPDPDREGRGRWAPVEAEAPAEIREEIHPLHPLMPRNDRAGDPARGARLLFGVVPTETAATEGGGAPRFDSRHLYRIRVFVRRHDDRCPRRRERNDCPGPLVWSRPSEPYRIASHSDLDGQKNVVVTAEMPDLGQLSSHTGPAGGLRMVSPEGSSLSFSATGSSPESGTTGGSEICTFPIPLITIVARFVFSLFLPVVVFLFQLFFLLPLKICIPPSVDLDALDLDIDLTGDVEDAVGLHGDTEVRAQLEKGLNAATRKNRDGEKLGTVMAESRSTAELWDALKKLAELPEEDGGDGGDDGDGGDGRPARSPVPDNLELEERVEERPRVDAPALLEAAG